VAGQISSRMDDLSATYAIAFPMTANYLKVLRTLRGSPVSERLNLVCYLLRRDGQVRSASRRYRLLARAGRRHRSDTLATCELSSPARP
jgi:hypothetical protein